MGVEVEEAVRDDVQEAPEMAGFPHQQPEGELNASRWGLDRFPL
jgi:hypothetical protein